MAHKLAIQTDRLGFGVEVEFGEAALKASPRRCHGVGSTQSILEDHEPATGFFGASTDLDGALENVERNLLMAGRFFQFGQSEMGVEGPLVEVLADPFGPEVVQSLSKVAAVGGDGLAKSIARPVLPLRA